MYEETRYFNIFNNKSKKDDTKRTDSEKGLTYTKKVITTHPQHMKRRH